MGIVVEEREDFPVVDFTKLDTNPVQVSDELFLAACRWEYLVLTGHGIPHDDIDEIFAMVCASEIHRRLS